jgi:site-specific recombinase XerD
MKTFMRVVGDLPVCDLTPVHGEEYYKWLTEQPGRYDDGILDFDTVKKTIGALRQFSKWLIGRNLAREDGDFMRRLTVRVKDHKKERQPWTMDDLKAIFGQPEMTKRDHHRFWYAAVALYSGMAPPKELDQLEFGDIVNLNGRPHFYVNRDSRHGHDKSLKTGQKRERQIPVHPELIRLGLMGWIEQRKTESKDGRIFPREDYELWFNHSKRGLAVRAGVKVHIVKTLYSFRHTFRDYLCAATDDPEIRDRIFGHSDKGTGAKYGQRNLRPHESAVIDRIQFAGFQL